MSRSRPDLAALDASIARGVADAEAGRKKLTASVFMRLKAKYAGQTPHKQVDPGSGPVTMAVTGTYLSPP